MSDPIKAAAERWRRLANGERGKVVYGFAKTEDEQLDECDYDLIDKARNRDAKILADAYLALGERQPDRYAIQADGVVWSGTEASEASLVLRRVKEFTDDFGDAQVVRVSTFIREEGEGA